MSDLMRAPCDSADACELLARSYVEATMVQQNRLSTQYNTPWNQAISLRFPIPCAQAAADELSANCRIHRFLLDFREGRIPPPPAAPPRIASENVIKLAQVHDSLRAAIRDYDDVARKTNDFADLIERHLRLVPAGPT